MRFLALLLIATALGAADVQPLAANQDLPYCRVVVSGSDNGTPVTHPHDGWWCAGTLQLFPLQARDLLDEVEPLDPATIVSVTPAATAPGRMPAQWRQAVNAYIAKHHPKITDAQPANSATTKKP